MALELAQLAGEFPMVVSFAIAGGFSILREGRRRSALNEAVHELRRPFQALALSLPEQTEADARLDSSLRMAAAAIDRLDQTINGDRGIETESSVPMRATVAATVARWQPRAELAGRPLELRCPAGETVVSGTRLELEQAVDNLISNAYEHGSGRVVVEAREEAGLLRVIVRDQGAHASGSSPSGRSRIRARVGGRARHGHGLRVVRRAAARHGGSFHLRRTSGRTEAMIELPLMGAMR